MGEGIAGVQSRIPGKKISWNNSTSGHSRMKNNAFPTSWLNLLSSDSCCFRKTQKFFRVKALILEFPKPLSLPHIKIVGWNHGNTFILTGTRSRGAGEEVQMWNLKCYITKEHFVTLLTSLKDDTILTIALSCLAQLLKYTKVWHFSTSSLGVPPILFNQFLICD